jgi:hypothetical protein
MKIFDGLCKCGRFGNHFYRDHNAVAGHYATLQESRRSGYDRLGEQDEMAAEEPAGWRELVAQAVAAALTSGEHDVADKLMKALKSMNGDAGKATGTEKQRELSGALKGITDSEAAEYEAKRIEMDEKDRRASIGMESREPRRDRRLKDFLGGQRPSNRRLGGIAELSEVRPLQQLPYARGRIIPITA